MILKNGKRLDGMGDSMPIGSIIEYNGTDIPDGWELVTDSDNDKINYIQCGFNEAFWIPDTNYKLLTFNNIRTNGDLFSYDSETNEVVVSETASIDEVKLHFHTMITAGGELPVEAIEVIVYKNDAIAAIINDGLDTASSRSATSLDYIVDCAPGDRFRVEARSYNNTYQMLSTYGRTLFSIEEVSNNVVIGDIETRELNTITAYSSTNVDLTAGNNIVFDTASITGSKFTLENGQIKIGAGVGKIRVSGQIWYWSNNTTRQWFTLNQNETVVNQMISYNTNYETMAFSSKIIDVNEGDVFYFKLHNTEGSGGIIVNNGASPKTMTFITIEEVTNVVNSDIDIQEKQPSAITAAYKPTTGSANWTIPESDVITKYPINTIYSQIGEGLTLNTTNGNVIIGKGISAVMVFVKATYYSNTAGNTTGIAHIYHNDISVAQSNFGTVSGAFMNVSNSAVLNVAEGDVIDLRFYGQQGDELGRNKNTVITVVELINNTTVGEGNPGEIYSEEEQVIGTYLGKPLYRKTMIRTYTSGTSVQVIEFKPDDNVERYIKAFGSIIRPGKSNWVYPGTSSITVYYPDSTMSYTIELTEAKTDITEVECTMEYTKTTD